MNSRMDKYQSDVAVKDRTDKNKKLYEAATDINVEYINIDNTNTIELDKISSKGNKKSREDYHRLRDFDGVFEMKNKEEVQIDTTEVQEKKIYDINEILKKAKEEKLFQDEEKKRLINTEYNILTKLDIEQLNNRDDLSKENLKSMIDDIYAKEEPKEKVEKELFADFMEPNEVVVDEEISKKILDKNVEIVEDINNAPTIEKTIVKENKIMDNDDTSNFEDIDKSNTGTIIIIVLVVLAILGCGGYFILKYFGII